MSALPHESLLPAQPFFSTPQQRMALARQRYFEEGVRPSGLVSEGVIQSWARCLHARRQPQETASFNPVTVSRVHAVLSRSRLLMEAAANELSQLESTLAGTSCMAILTDPHGVVVHATRTAARNDLVLTPLIRTGVSLAEEVVGTNAPGMTAHTGQPSVVMGGEHFFGNVTVMHCAAAPIRDVHGRLAGVLDVSSESRPFGFDAAAVVALCATSIENRLLRAQSREHIVLHFQLAPQLLSTPMEALAGVSADGRVAWVNNAAARLLGLPPGSSALTADEVFGLPLAQLGALTRRVEAATHRLPNGLNVWLRAHLQFPDGVRGVFALQPQPQPPIITQAEQAKDRPQPVDPVSCDLRRAAPDSGELPTAAEPPADGKTTLRTAGLHLIEQTLAACGGNVSMAARRLGVSRGLVYRHVKKALAG